MALAGSVLLHASLLAGGAWLLAQSLRDAPPLVRAAEPLQAVEVAELALPEVAGDGPDTAAPSELPPPLEITTGGRHAPRPDLQAPGRGGERTSLEAATNLASSIDPLALERDPQTSRDRSQVTRLHTAWKRASRDDRRATPEPMELTFLATGPGHLRVRRAYAPTDPARGMVSGGVASTVGSKLGGQGATDVGEEPDAALGGPVAGSETAQLGQGAADAGDVREFHAEAKVLFARPLVPAARAAVPTQQRARPSDTLDSSQEVAAKVSSLLQASSAGGEPGPGFGGQVGGGPPGAFGASGVGSRSSPSGAAFGRDFADDPGFSGYARALRSQLERVLAKAFPDWAIAEGRGGHVIFDMTLRADGKPAAVRLVRPSGIGEYDENVLRAVSAVTSFGRLPKGFGTPAQFRVSWDALNPVVGRNGPGPGGQHR